MYQILPVALSTPTDQIDSRIADNTNTGQTQEGDIVDSVKPKPKRRGRLTEAEKEARDESKIPGRKIDLQATIKAKNKKIREAREELDKYKGKLRACRLENEENKKRLNVSESSLTRMRDEIFTQVEQAKPYFETDEQVAQAFTRVFEAVNNWTKKHAIPCEKTDQKGFETTISILCNDDRYPDFMSKKMKEAVKLGTVYPYVTTAAAINRIFAEEVFDNPFTFLSQRPHGDLELDMIVWLMSVALMKGRYPPHRSYGLADLDRFGARMSQGAKFLDEVLHKDDRRERWKFSSETFRGNGRPQRAKESDYLSDSHHETQRVIDAGGCRSADNTCTRFDTNCVCSHRFVLSIGNTTEQRHFEVPGPNETAQIQGISRKLGVPQSM